MVVILGRGEFRGGIVGAVGVRIVNSDLHDDRADAEHHQEEDDHHGQVGAGCPAAGTAVLAELVGQPSRRRQEIAAGFGGHADQRQHRDGERTRHPPFRPGRFGIRPSGTPPAPYDDRFSEQMAGPEQQQGQSHPRQIGQPVLDGGNRAADSGQVAEQPAQEPDLEQCHHQRRGHGKRRQRQEAGHPQLSAPVVWPVVGVAGLHPGRLPASGEDPLLPHEGGQGTQGGVGRRGRCDEGPQRLLDARPCRVHHLGALSEHEQVRGILRIILRVLGQEVRQTAACGRRGRRARRGCGAQRPRSWFE